MTDIQRKRFWVEPEGLPHAGDVSDTAGNVPPRIKQLAWNTFCAYGVGGEESFGYEAGRKARLVYAGYELRSGERDDGGERRSSRSEMEVKTILELVVDKSMVNGNGMLHGGCTAYLIDNCAAFPLVILGLLTDKNGVGVTQALNILFQSPAQVGTTLEIVSTSLALGSRSMTSRCEIFCKGTGRLVASAFLNKMEPAKL